MTRNASDRSRADRTEVNPHDWHVRPVTRDDATALDAINRACPIQADFEFFFDRRPDFFAWPDAVFDHYDYAAIEHRGRLVGFVMLAQSRGWVGEDHGSWFYVGDARLLPEARGRELGKQAAATLGAELGPDVGIGLGLVKRGNVSAHRAVARARIEGFWAHPLGEYDVSNLLLLANLGRPRTCRVRRGESKDIEALVALMRRAWAGRLYAPDMTVKRLSREIGGGWPGMSPERYYLAERDGRLVGALAAWDLGAIKQTRVLGYPFTGRVLRAGHRLLRVGFRRAAPLPMPGEAFRALHVTRLAIDPRDPSVLRDLLRAVVHDHLGAGYHMIHVGLCRHDPLLRALDRWPVQHFVSNLYAFGRDEPRWQRIRHQPNDPYVDLVII